MANPYSALVNDALYKASLQLDLLAALARQSEHNASVRTLLLSHRDAAFYHLVCAYRLFLLELAHAQNHSPTALTNATELIALGESAEAARLLQLEQAPGSFLAKIISEERRAWSGQQSNTTNTATGMELIATTTVNEESDELSSYIEAMKKLVSDCRETLIEW